MDVLIIEFSILNQRMSRYTAGVIASNSYGYLKFKFNFKTFYVYFFYYFQYN